MRYMLLMHGTQADWQSFATLPPQDRRAHAAFLREIDRQLSASGELVAIQGSSVVPPGGLAAPAQARLVQAGAAGAPAVITGAFPEGREFLAGFWVVDCDSPTRASEIAAQVSAAPGRGGAPLNLPVEVRPMMRAPGEEM